MDYHSSAIPNIIGHTIDGGRLRLTDVLGSGSNGVVFLAVDTASPTITYAVKCIIKAPKGTRRYKLQRREIHNHKLASSHPNVVTLHRVVEDVCYIFLVMDYCPGGDFLKFLSERRDMCGNDALVKMFLFQILDAVETCHEMGIFHRDIKPENILCSADGTQLYLSDFGLSTRKPDSLRFGAGSSYFMSPECIGSDVRQKAYSTRANDVWALGVIMVNMITGRNPWRKATMADECYRAYIHDPNFLQNMLPISCDANVILQQVFAANPLYRISLSHLRAMILQIDTFFMTRKEIAGANSHVRKAAETYYGTSECLMLHEKTSPKQSHGAFTAYSLDKHAVEIGEKSLLVLAPFGPPFSDGEDICRVPRSYPTNTALKETSAPSDVESDGPMTPDESPSRSFLTIPSFPGGAKAARSLATQVSSYSKRSGISLSSGFIRRAIEKLHLR